jgi:L-cystine uptake protein TcyP (sodium:dicarboxylate symporter family)
MQITRFSVHQTAKIVALAYFCMTLLFVPFFVLMAFQNVGPLKWFALAAPIFYTVMGYVFTALSCVLYNFLAKRVGGIEFEVSEGLDEPRATVTTTPN